MSLSKENRIGAAIDMGTNTFHILIAEERKGVLFEMFRKRKWVNLAENGIARISETALARAWEALEEFRDVLNDFPEIDIRIVATEAFRSADNGVSFLRKVKHELGFETNIISGDIEAELIYKGISLISPGGSSPSLIMDIGGGSTEFILYDKNGILWSQSYRAGVTYLYNQYAHSDPMNVEDEKSIKDYFEMIFPALLAECNKYKIKSLIGASGSFEILEILSGKKPNYRNVNDIKIADFYQQFSILRTSTEEERLSHHHIPHQRARMIVVALILMEYIITSVKPNKISVSPYAMKEGIISELLNI